MKKGAVWRARWAAAAKQEGCEPTVNLLAMAAEVTVGSRRCPLMDLETAPVPNLQP